MANRSQIAVLENIETLLAILAKDVTSRTAPNESHDFVMAILKERIEPYEWRKQEGKEDG